MITWCQECWSVKLYPGLLCTCQARIDMGYGDLAGLFDVLYPRREFNTVDLKQLRKDRERRKYVTMRGRFG